MSFRVASRLSSHRGIDGDQVAWTEVEEARSNVLASRGRPVSRCMPPRTPSIRRCSDAKGLPFVAPRGGRPGFSTMEKKLPTDQVSWVCVSLLGWTRSFRTS